jgi:YggT family protein
VSGFIFLVLQLLLTVLWLLVVGRVLMSWINPKYEGPVGRFLFETTEPHLAPIRRVMPSSGTVDFTPLVLLVVLGFLVQVALFR